MATPVLSVGEERGGFTVASLKSLPADKVRVGRVKRRPLARERRLPPLSTPSQALPNQPSHPCLPGGELGQGMLPRPFGRPTDCPQAHPAALTGTTRQREAVLAGWQGCERHQAGHLDYAHGRRPVASVPPRRGMMLIATCQVSTAAIEAYHRYTGALWPADKFIDGRRCRSAPRAAISKVGSRSLMATHRRWRASEPSKTGSVCRDGVPHALLLGRSVVGRRVVEVTFPAPIRPLGQAGMRGLIGQQGLRRG
jgi:hypothetical protein